MDGQDDRAVGSSGGSLTLLKFALVVVVVAVVASAVMPKVWVESEKPRISDALAYLAAVRTAQESYHADAGLYADDLAKLRIATELPIDFSASAVGAGDTGSLASSWRLTLTRIAPTSFGSYTIVFGERGFDAQRSTIDEKASINPFLKRVAKRAVSPNAIKLAASASIQLASATEGDGGVVGVQGGATASAAVREAAPSSGSDNAASRPSPGPCGSAASPRCDGHCAEGNACVIKNDHCICVPTPTPCGALASFPLCYGVCPPGQVCRDVGSGCECGG